MNQQNPYQRWQIALPILLAVALCVGIMAGYWIAGGGIHIFKSDSITTNTKKFKEILSYIEEYYVDTVNTDEVASHAYNQILQKLDPHSAYISLEDVKLANAPLQGGFEGIGVEFLVIQDTIEVVAVIAGGPCERVGMLAGDRIVEVDTQNVAGIRITSRQVVDLLRGEKGTKVKLGVKRRGVPQTLYFTVTRAKIPTHSLEVSYMVNDSIGYIKLSRFAGTTYDEFMTALTTLRKQGMTKLMLDLRNNGGGYLDKAIDIADEFLDSNKLIVYTDGKGKRYDEKYYARNTGDFEDGQLVVLINEASASASEILAGALQDNDRALIVGRRSYGKGLVQRPIALSDGSELRITISRYYTPSGRCIQKAYTNHQDYENDLEERYRKGEYFDQNNIKFTDTVAYKTLGGRTVYGGGGIMPDVFVPQDTSYFSPLYQQVSAKGVIREFAIDYANQNRAVLEKYPIDDFVRKFAIDPKIEQGFWQYCRSVGIIPEPEGLKRSADMIRLLLKAFIAKSMWKDEGFYKVYNTQDEIYNQALQQLLH